ncbi:MAG: GldG family protein [Candidatus Marinimicrobia bacterium]|jgi:ABC-type uncharacterized transport system involved in gliding motility auxiliary subunit|nr:GldG family protein [Candidatus Neomarinimicrobiota bacterium]MBT3633120.1 GldG family protein [Candidatus Neomarinimicrobiota bacterium]MBT3682279.1 GldG family protein [Candidatus Neomarinimicrobiota bacterium]MBT3758720.1 GldG family protein [Candidatus Neomarinimicrobiota bacterium]MBT3895406.1 GldG family protein [Candidatus Neomarinimicrobiota bacterium]
MFHVKDKKSFLLYIGFILLVVILINVISRNIHFRLDFTENNIYSLSESSELIVDKIDDILTMKVYFSDNLPGEYGNNKRYLQDILEEYAALSNGKIRFEFYPPESDEKMEEEALKYGIQPVQLQVVENDKLEIKKVYMGMVFIYEDLRETIPVIQTTTGLEYDITTKIKKMVDTRKKSIGIVNLTESAEPQNQTISEILSQSYNIRPVDPANPIQGDISVLLVDGVEDSVSVDVLDNLRSFVARGGNIFMAQGRIKSDLQTQSATVIQSNIFDFLDEVGLHVNDNLVLDALCSQVTISQNRGFFRMNSAVDYNFFPMIRKFGDHVTVSGLEQLRLLFSSEIEYQATDVMDSTVNRITPLLITSDKSTTMEQFFNLSPIDNPAFTSLNEPGRVVGALTSIASNSTGGVSQIILISDSRFFEDGGASPENAVFLLNAVDYLMGDSDLVSLRSREITTRPLEEIEDGAKSRWKWINILLASVLVIIFGFARLKRDSARTKILEEIYE